ncbi:MAG: ATP-binding protein [Gammaproteobacteria bacterium]|nr:ATP-binding protein [Gammaproteobacteria bacterium]MCH9744666.1 ATP-binding protein [Gammaproteobacteria bacterium]
MFQRSIQSELEHLMTQYAVVTITGPRQSGKTTLVKSSYPNRPYYNLENPDTRAFIESDPKQFLYDIDLKQGVILDEIQRIPELLSYIQVLVDENRVPGSFILTGSHQLQLSEAISQSLAGRTALLELLPLSINELKSNEIQYTANEYCLNGFLPAIYQHNLDPTINSRNYINTYVERDIRQIINIKDLHSFQKFIRLCAGRIGSTINRESLANEVGVSQNTIKSWMSILEASYLTFHLQPYFENFGKRIVKAPKLYFLDVGLVSYLLGIQSTEQMKHEKLKGNIFENLMIMEILKYQYNRGQDANIYFFRDSNQNEVDIVLKIHDKLIPIEIKSTSTFHHSLLKNVRHFQALVGERAPVGFLIYTGDYEQKIDNIQVVNYKNMHEIMRIIQDKG